MGPEVPDGGLAGLGTGHGYRPAPRVVMRACEMQTGVGIMSSRSAVDWVRLVAKVSPARVTTR
jgi:hypothetical protein